MIQVNGLAQQSDVQIGCRCVSGVPGGCTGGWTLVFSERDAAPRDGSFGKFKKTKRPKRSKKKIQTYSPGTPNNHL